MIKLIHIYRSETDLNAHTRSDKLLYLIVRGWCTFFILLLGKMLSLINVMGFSTLPVTESRHRSCWSVNCAPAIPPLFCFHQHLVISSFNYSPVFSSVLSSCQAPFSFSQKPSLSPEFQLGIWMLSISTSLFLHTHANPSAVSGSSWAWCFPIRLMDFDFKYMTVLSSWWNVISKDLYFSCTQAGPMPRILRQFLPNYFSLPYVKTVCNSTPIGHLHSCWQQLNLYHWVQDQPREKHQECAFHFLFTDEYTVQGNSASIWDQQSSCAHLILLWDDHVAEEVS